MPRIVVLALGLVAFSSIAGEFDWKVSAESGYFRAKSKPALHSLSALQTMLAYSGGAGKTAWSVQWRMRPEWFDPEHQMLSGSVNAWVRRTAGSWQIRAIAGGREQWYRLDQADLRIHTLQFQAGATYQRWRSFWPEAEYRFIRTSSEAESRNIIVANAATLRGRHFYSERGSWSGGVFTERFRARTNDIFTVPEKNLGWRNGLEFRLDYTRAITVNLQYLISWRTSQWTRGRSMEQEINAVIGRSFAGRWSVFVLAEYYLRQLDRKNQITKNLLYTNSNYDNRVFAKLGYDVTVTQNVFLKLAYMRNELIQEKTRLSGGQVAVGYEIRK